MRAGWRLPGREDAHPVGAVGSDARVAGQGHELGEDGGGGANSGIPIRGTTRRRAFEAFRNMSVGPVIHHLSPHHTTKRAHRWKRETSTSSSVLDDGKSEH